jgi:hypothetical protein
VREFRDANGVDWIVFLTKEAVSLRRRMRANRDEPGRERADFRPQPGDRSA